MRSASASGSSVSRGRRERKWPIKKTNPSGVGLKTDHGSFGMLLPRGWLFSGRDPVAPLSVHQLNRAVHAAAETAGIKKRALQGGHPQHAGNGFLMRRGFNLVWSGWQGDVPPGADRLTARFPTIPASPVWCARSSSPKPPRIARRQQYSGAVRGALCWHADLSVRKLSLLIGFQASRGATWAPTHP